MSGNENIRAVRAPGNLWLAQFRLSAAGPWRTVKGAGDKPLQIATEHGALFVAEGCLSARKSIAPRIATSN